MRKLRRFRITKHFYAYPQVDSCDWGLCIRCWTRGWCSGFVVQLGPLMVNIHNEGLGDE